MVGCLKFTLIVILLNVDHSEEKCCYDKKKMDKYFWQFPEEKYMEFISWWKWPSPLIHFDVDPHLDPLIRNYVAQAILYMNTGGDYIFHYDEHERFYRNHPNTTCVYWRQRRTDGFDDDILYWVTFYQARDEKKAMIESDTGTGAYKPDINARHTHIFLGYRQALENLFQPLLWVEKNKIQKAKYDPTEAYLSAILHEMMHTLGFIHEHQRRDRDCWVWVDAGLIRVGQSKRHSFQPLQQFCYSGLFPYDMHSVTHYNKQAGFYPHNESILMMGRVDGRISAMDWRKINYMYCGRNPDCHPNMEDKCSKNLDFYQSNPNCFREGKDYGRALTCKEC